MTEIQRLRELLAKATERPWDVGDPTRGDSPLMVYCNDTTGQRIADLTNEYTFHSEEEKAANAALIVAAVNALPGLLDRVERMEEALRDARDGIRSMRFGTSTACAYRKELLRTIDAALSPPPASEG